MTKKYLRKSLSNSEAPIPGTWEEFDPTTVDYLKFRETPSVQVPTAVGVLSWNPTEKTLDLQMPDDITLQIGQETQQIVTNNTGSPLLNGQVVRVSGATGNRVTIALADADGVGTNEMIGMLTQDIANNQSGKVTLLGLVRQINTSAFAEGASVYLSTTPGGITTTPPALPTPTVLVGYVARSHAVNGSILVHVRKNPTPAEIGAVDKSGDTMSGALRLLAPRGSGKNHLEVGGGGAGNAGLLWFARGSDGHMAAYSGYPDAAGIDEFRDFVGSSNANYRTWWLRNSANPAGREVMRLSTSGGLSIGTTTDPGAGGIASNALAGATVRPLVGSTAGVVQAQDPATFRDTIGVQHRNEAVNTTVSYPGPNSGYFLLSTAAETVIPANQLVEGLVVRMKAYAYVSVDSGIYFDVIGALSDANTGTYPAGGAYDTEPFAGSAGGNRWIGFLSGKIQFTVEIRLGAITSGTTRRVHYLWSAQSDGLAPQFWASDNMSLDVSVPRYPHLAIDLAGNGSINKYVYSVEIQKP